MQNFISAFLFKYTVPVSLNVNSKSIIEYYSVLKFYLLCDKIKLNLLNLKKSETQNFEQFRKLIFHFSYLCKLIVIEKK